MHALLNAASVGLLVGTPRLPPHATAPQAFAVAAYDRTDISAPHHTLSQRVDGRELIFPANSLAVADEELDDEALEARNAARRVAGIVFFLGAAPSFFAQNELVWKKERAKAELEEKERQRKEASGLKFGLGGGGLPAEVQAVVAARFKRSYPQKDVLALWTEVKRAYKSEANAVAAVSANPTILNPKYTSPPALVGRSKAALVAVLGEEEAIEVLLKNPALLQCGASLAKQPAGQIKSFAAFRSVVDGLPAASPPVVLGAFATIFFVALAGKNGLLPAEADGLVRGASVLLGVGGVSVTLIGAVLQNVAETGRPKK